MTGKVIASCGHEMPPGEWPISVSYHSEDCDAVDGFRPCIVYASFCAACAAEAATWPEFIPRDTQA